ncbi:hypothetical protein EPO15_14690 [bacterium]|nr:MAG: hypothetical protein EPO15_14690 [bacterium]
MDAAEFLAWARPLAGGGAAARFFLELPESLLAAAGSGHFLESSLSVEKGFKPLKLALILADGPGELPAARRDAPGKARAAESVLAALEAEAPRPGAAAARVVLAALARWRLRGSLMLSLDFDPAAGRFEKLSLYGYLPGPEALPELLTPFGLAADAARLKPLAGPTLAFFGVDVPVRGPAVLKLYNKTPWPDAGLPEPARSAAPALLEAGPLRDVTRMTRLGTAASEKVYLGFARGVPLAELGRLRAFGGGRGPLSLLGEAGRRLKARFVGFDAGTAEVYFDASGFGPREDLS